MTKAWREKRDVITRLYIHENRTLNEVKSIMEEDHDFNASTRSYRQHFDEWDLSKYNCKKRTARRQSRARHRSAGEHYPAAVAGENTVSDLPSGVPGGYDQPMSPQSCNGSLSPESVMDGIGVDELLGGTTATAHQRGHTQQSSPGRSWEAQYMYAEGRRHQQKQYPHQYLQQQRLSWDQQRGVSGAYGTLPSPPAEATDTSSYYQMFSTGEGIPSQSVHAQAYQAVHPDPRQHDHYQHQQGSQLYSGRRLAQALLVPERRENVPYYNGVQCGARQPGQQ